MYYTTNPARRCSCAVQAVAGASGAFTKGVDSTAQPQEALVAGKQLAKDVGCVVAITGAVDLVCISVLGSQMEASSCASFDYGLQRLTLVV